MIPSMCGLDVYALVQKSECSPDSTSPKVLVSPDNKICVCQDDVPLKTLKYDNICSQDSKDDVFESMAKSITKDVFESINRVIFVYNFSGNDVAHAMDRMTFCSFVLNNMCTTVNSQKKCDQSLHVSFFKVDCEGVMDLMQKSYIASNDLKAFEFFLNQTRSNLVEKIVTSAEDIDKIVEEVFQKAIANTCLDCCHTVVLSTVIVKTRNFDGLEIMKTGRFILVDVGACVQFLKEVTNTICIRRESFYLIPDTSSVPSDLKLKNCSLSRILKNFLSKSKISILITLPPFLSDMEHLHALEIISEMQNLRLNPAINEKLILRESLKDYADEIKSLEKDLLVLKNNNGIFINQQKYRSLKNRHLLCETQLRDLHEERKSFKYILNNKKETLERLQQEMQVQSICIVGEMKELKFLQVSLEDAEEEKISLKQKKIEKVDLCASINNLLNFNIISLKNQNCHLVKIKHASEKSSSNMKLLKENINDHIFNTTMEQNSLKDKIELLLLQLKEILSNSTILKNNFIRICSDFNQKFEEMVKLWKNVSASLIVDFHIFLKKVLNYSILLENNLLSELAALNFTEDGIIEIMKKSNTETLQMLSSCSTKIKLFIENSIKLLYEFLFFLEIIQGKAKEQLKTLESTICCHSNDRLKFFSSTYSTMVSMYQYLNEHLDLSSKINSDIFSHHQKLKQCVCQEFTKMNEAFTSLKTFFCRQQTFVIDKWQQKQTHLSSVKERGGVSESLQLCAEEHPNLLDKLRQQCGSSLDELYSILKDKSVAIDNLSSQLKHLFSEIECSIKDCSEGNKKKVSQQENIIRDNLEIQDEKISKCMITTRSLIEDLEWSITEALQNGRNSFFNIKDLKKNIDVYHIILDMRNNINGYLTNYANILKINELALQQLPKPVLKQTENLEESFEFNHEEFLSSTPISCHERSKNLIKDKSKFLNSLGKIAAMEFNDGYQSNPSLDQEKIINPIILPLPSIGSRTKVEIPHRKNLGHRRAAK